MHLPAVELIIRLIFLVFQLCLISSETAFIPAQGVSYFYPSDILLHSTEHVGLLGLNRSIMQSEKMCKKIWKLKALNSEAVFAFQRLSCLEPDAESLSLALVIAIWGFCNTYGKQENIFSLPVAELLLLVKQWERQFFVRNISYY